MSVEIAGFAQDFARCFEFENVDPLELEHVLAEADEPLNMMVIEPCVEPPVIQSGTQFDYLLFVQSGTVVPWTFPRSELNAPFLIGVHEFLALAERWIGTYSAATETIVVTIPVGVMKLIADQLPAVRENMHQRVMRRLARFYWTSLATSGSKPSRVAAALVSRLSLSAEDHGQDRTLYIRQKDLGRLTTLSRAAVAHGLSALAEASVISFGNDRSARFAGEVLVPDVDCLKAQAFDEARRQAMPN